MSAADREHRELAAHLLQLLERRLFDPLEILLGTGPQLDELRDRAAIQAAAWASDLLDDTERQAAHTLARLVGTLWPGDEVFDPPASWWRTPLGQVAVRRVGHPTAAAVTYAVAGAMLGVTRQGVHDLLTRGKLDRHPDGGVTVASVRERLRLREAAYRGW
ncbi:hypothetical protein ACWDWO_17610 [Actinopolymorpha singaporensis]|uniref:Uncharacterized protein n=1 Tax=Actinopolymorpha singaporensis TaxID=117157 RepID=A0A1H1MZT6_9ACTN|nr:hypothetical protein [Actinopolymorpha singaporensis]SDR92128.1 hypothetical protein SAMN04489717_1035 [Actinopolymorpha singaporensis]